MRRATQFALPLAVAAAIVAVWQVAVSLTQTRVFPSPAAVLLGFAELFRKGLLWRYAADSLFRVAVGYCLAVALAIPVGIVLGSFSAAADTVNPVIQLLRPISPIAWIPIAIIWFGITNAAAIFLIFLAAFFPTALATMNAVRNIPQMFLRAGRNFGLSSPALLAKVVFPAALPQILMGMRISLGVAWLVVVAAEMIAVDSGLGYLIIDSRNAGKRYDLVVAGMLLIGVIGFALDTAIRRLNALKFVRWGVSS